MRTNDDSITKDVAQEKSVTQKLIDSGDIPMVSVHKVHTSVPPIECTMRVICNHVSIAITALEGALDQAERNEVDADVFKTILCTLGELKHLRLDIWAGKGVRDNEG